MTLFRSSTGELDRQMVFWIALLIVGISGFTLAFLGTEVFHWWD